MIEPLARVVDQDHNMDNNCLLMQAGPNALTD